MGSANLVDWEYDEGATAGNLCDDGHKFGVDGAEERVVGISCDFNVIIAALPSHWLPIDVAELGAAHPSEGQLKYPKSSQRLASPLACFLRGKNEISNLIPASWSCLLVSKQQNSHN